MSSRLGFWLLGGALIASLTGNLLLLASRGTFAPKTTAAPPGEMRVASEKAPLTSEARPDAAHDPGRKWVDQTVEVAERDFDAALERLETRPGEMSRDSALAALITGVGEKHLDQLEKLLLQIAPGWRQGIWENVMTQWARKDPDVLLDFARQAPSGPMKTCAYGTLVRRLAEANSFESAATALGEMPVSEDRSMALQAFVGQMGNTDPDAALSWVTELPSPGDRTSMKSYLVSAFREKLGLERLTAIANSSEEAKVRTACVEAMAQLFPENTTPAIAGDWVRALPADLRNPAIARLCSDFAEKDPIAWGVLMQSIEDPQQRDSQIGNVAAHLASLDPRRAIEFAASFPQPENQASAAQYLIDRWKDMDAPAAEKWVQDLAPGQFKDSALIGLAWHFVFTDKQKARSIAGQISDAKRREQFLKKYASHL